jgi:hypothetical protein
MSEQNGTLFSVGRTKMCKRERLAINVLPAHKRAIEQMAQADGERMSVILRQLIRKEAKARGQNGDGPIADDGGRCDPGSCERRIATGTH